MDHKSWPWKKKAAEKNGVVADKANLSFRNEEETLLSDKAELERELKVVNDKLSSALLECRAKDDFAKKQVKIAQEAIAGWEKTETEAIMLNQELEKALQHRVADEERLNNLDAALKECMQQLRFVRDEQENRIQDTVSKTSKEFEKTRTLLEEKLTDAGKKLSRLCSENAQLSKALMAKEKATDYLKSQVARTEADFSALKIRLESVEKENASLLYEVRVLEKELEIRNEEREFNQRTADVAHKQHLESVKKIAKLESESQRLRNLVRKKLPGPAALAIMKNEVDMLGKDHVEMRRRKSNPFANGSLDLTAEAAPDTPNRKVNMLSEQLCMMEEENRNLKEALIKKTNEFKLSRLPNARTTSKLSQAEGQFEELQKGCLTVESGKYSPSVQELSLTSLSDMGSDDKVSCAESWAPALISELEHFKNEKQVVPLSSKSVGASDINLMDDFAEMEKLAVESTNDPLEAVNHALQKECADYGDLQSQSRRDSSEADSRERLPVLDCQTDNYVPNHNIQLKGISTNSGSGYIDNILKMLLEHGHVTQRSPYEILEDIKIALAQKYSSTHNPAEANGNPIDSDVTCTPNIGDRISQEIPDQSYIWRSSNAGTGHDVSTVKKCEPNILSYMGTSINKVIEIIEGISIPSTDDSIPEILSGKDNGFLPYGSAQKETAYMVRVFQWKTSELSAILQEFVQTCRDVLNGKVPIEKFAERLTCTLEWIVNHCFSLQDVSCMKDAIKHHFDWDDSRSENEMETGVTNPIFEFDKLHTGREKSLYSPIGSTLSGRMSSAGEEEVLQSVDDESQISKDEFSEEGPTKVDLEGKLQSETLRSESLIVQLQESEETIKGLQKDVETLTKSKGTIKDQIEKEKMANEDLEMQLTAAKLELDEACQKACCLQKELEHKNNSCEKLESTSSTLQLQQKSMQKMELSENNDADPEEKLLQSDREITAASEKLAECQETILNLGKQLKALASPGDAALFDKVISTTSETTTSTMTTPKKSFGRRSSLLDKMLAEDNELGSPTTKEIILDAKINTVFNASVEPPEKTSLANGSTHTEYEAVTGSLTIVPSKKKNGLGVLKKLLRRRKKKSSSVKELHV